MRIERHVRIDAGRDETWSILWDVERIASCIRGVSNVEVIEPMHTYAARVEQRVGPFRVTFQVGITVVEVLEPERIVVDVTGQDPRIASRIRSQVAIELVPAAGSVEATDLCIDAQVTIQGKLATLGQGIINRKADQELDYFRDALAAELRRGGVPNDG